VRGQDVATVRSKQRGLPEPDRARELEERLPVVRLLGHGSAPDHAFRDGRPAVGAEVDLAHDEAHVGTAVAVDAQQPLAAEVQEVRGLCEVARVDGC
jgi:hypothetical protein